MSFSSDLKNEIINESHKSACCRKAFLSGVLFSKARAVGDSITVSVENDAFSNYTAKLVQEFYGRTPEISSSARGGRCRIIRFSSKSAARYLYSESLNTPYVSRCQACSSAFFKGIFFACGNVSNPENQYLLEFSPVSSTEKFLETFRDFDTELKMTTRRSKISFYLKKSEAIEDFFAKVGMNDAVFAFMNAKIKGEFRNNANRIANCETNNIGKAVSASHKQISIIDELDKANLLSSLPEELEKTARLRIRYRDLSLSQLAAVSIPPISKSGLSHRLNRIMELAPHLMPALKK